MFSIKKKRKKNINGKIIITGTYFIRLDFKGKKNNQIIFPSYYFSDRSNFNVKYFIV